jgi:hypothetical protein
MKFFTVLVLLVGLFVALFVTNPSRAEVDAEIQSQLLTRIDGLDTNTDQDPVVQLIFTTCKFGRSACASFIQSLLNVEYEDKILFSKITVSFGNEDPVQCYGALTRVICLGL